MRRIARFVVRRSWWVLGAALLFVPIAGLTGGAVAPRLSVGGFEDPGAESALAADDLLKTFGTGEQNVLLLVTAKAGSVDDAGVAKAGSALTERLGREPKVRDAVSYWTLNRAPPLRSKDGSQALVLARVAGDEDSVKDEMKRLSPRYTVDGPLISSKVGGAAEVFRQVTQQAEEDLHKAELITAPVTFAALVIVFGGVVAGLLPLGVALLAVLGTFVALTVITWLTQVSIFSLNLTTALGLGLAVDYSLFMVSRFREELREGQPPPLAIVHTMQTAGRTVAFSAATVAVSMAALLVFPMAYLRSFAYAGIAVVALAAISAVLVLPALLAVLGTRVDKGRLWRRQDGDHGEGFWHGQALRVMRRPLPYIAVVVAVLLLLGVPFLRLDVGLTDDRVVPDSLSSRAVNDEIRKGFDTKESGAMAVVQTTGRATQASDVEAYAARLSRLSGVARVDAGTGYYLEGKRALPPDQLSERFRSKAARGGTWLSVVPKVEPVSAEGEALVKAVRAAPAPFPVRVTGPSARLVDTRKAVASRLPLALAVIALATFVLLFLMVGSLLVPLKALVLNVLSLTATFGAMVWVFQDGHLSGVLGFTPTGFIDVFTPILMFCIAFGLSMDYEVFLLSRIKEEYDLTGDNERSVALGLQRTGRIVTAAALLLAVVFVAFATSKVAIVKLFGVGLTVAVLVDAFLIRATLVPAFMRLAGRANWWAPRALRRFHLRYGLFEVEPVAILDLREGYGVPAAESHPQK